MSDVPPETHPETHPDGALDYDLDDSIAADTPARMKALSDPLRMVLVDLVLERAMTVSELADEVGRPRGTIAYHVDVLVEAGLLTVVRTRRVRAIDERYYGRTARTYVLDHTPDDLPFVRDALASSRPAEPGEPTGSTIRHARIPADRVRDYIDRLHAISLEFSSEPRSGDIEYALMFHVFPTRRLQKPIDVAETATSIIDEQEAP